MSRCYEYAIVRFATDPVRDETLNVGLIVFADDGLSVHLPKSLDKIRAISGAVSVEDIRASLERLPDLYKLVETGSGVTGAGAMKYLAEVAPCDFSPIGTIYADSEHLLSTKIDALLVRLVEPEPAPQRAVQSRNTRLLADMKAAFRVERVLAKKGESLDAHRIVTNHKIAEGLSADLLLKNGCMHVIQAADASAGEASFRRAITSIAVSSLVFEQARMKFGDINVSSKLVYKASSLIENMVNPSLAAAEHQGAKLINWESRDDRTRFIVELSSLAEPFARDIGAAANVHASIQPRFKLN